MSWGGNLSLEGNVTIDDADPSITYLPTESWRTSSTICTNCLNPDLRNGYLGTYHDGTHVLPSGDLDDITREHGPSMPGSGSMATEEPTGEKTGRGSGNGKEKQRSRNIQLPGNRRLDSDDPGFVDSNVTMAFQFTGSAIYVFCVQPLGIPRVNTTPTEMDLTFYIDDNKFGTFNHQGSEQAMSYLPGVNVFSKTDLSEASHVLQVNVGLNSVFLFDYLIYTQIEEPSSSNNFTEDPSSNPTAPGMSTPSQKSSLSTKQHNIATFAGAIGGSVGVLGLLSLGLALSIIKRRRDYERREHAALQTGDTPQMIGPRPFIPRFFPETSPDPPPYVESVSGSSTSEELRSPAITTTQLMQSSAVDTPVSYAPHMAHLTHNRSYADVPPSAPPPPLHDLHLIPPPPFGEVIAFTSPPLRESMTTPSDEMGIRSIH